MLKQHLKTIKHRNDSKRTVHKMSRFEHQTLLIGVDWRFASFSSVPQANSWTVTQIRPRRIPSTYSHSPNVHKFWLRSSRYANLKQ
jgi:hypothetical protein